MAPEEESGTAVEAEPGEPTTATPAVAAATPASSNRAAWIVAGVATAVALIAAMIAVSAVMRDKNTNNVTTANGAPNLAAFRGANGTIQSIKGSSFTVLEQGGGVQGATSTSTATVTTNNKTTYSSMVNGTVADLKAGDAVVVVGTQTNNVVTATRINQRGGQANVFRNRGNAGGGAGTFGGNGGPANGGGFFRGGGGGGGFFGGGGGAAGNRIAGDIKSVDGTTITLAALDGTTLTVNTDANTVVQVNKTITFKDLKVGDTVRVIGAANGNKITAAAVTKVPGNALGA